MACWKDVPKTWWASLVMFMADAGADGGMTNVPVTVRGRELEGIEFACGRWEMGEKGR